MLEGRPIPRWLRSAHVQTIGAAVPLHSPPRSHAGARAELLRVPIEGGFVHARAWWADGASAEAPRTAVVIVHGIAGSSDSHCCVRAAAALHRAGYHAVRMDMRGAGESVADAPSLYHAGLTSDLDAVVRFVARDARVSSVAVLGFSGGGSVALKLAGQWGDEPPPAVRAVASLSAPLDYPRVAARMDTWVCLPYRFHVLRGLLARARLFAELHPSRARFDLRDLPSIKRFRRYDGEIIGPMHGFDDVDRYYAEASAGPWLRRVRVPTVVVHADDDPMVPGETVRPWLDAASSAITTVVTPHGGHLGWLHGLEEEHWVASGSVRHALAFFREHAPPAGAAHYRA